MTATLRAGLAAAWVRALRLHGPVPALPESGILVLWHSDMLPCLRAFARTGMRVLVSRSRDGDFGAEVAARLGYRVVRGSSSRGGAAALRAIARDLRDNGGWIALVADGPRGPRGVCKPGAAWLSQTLGLPVVGARATCPLGITLGGWARVRVPLPGSTFRLRVSAPFHPLVPREVELHAAALDDANPSSP